MKVKDLLKELSTMDPESEVVVGGTAIHFIEELPGYYDGFYESLIENGSKKPYYCVEGMKFSRRKTKVNIHTLSIEDIIWNCETKEEVEALKWEFEDLDERSRQSVLERIKAEKEKHFDYLKGEGK